MKLGLIVEGDGDIEAIPILIRTAFYQMNRYDLILDRPIKCGSLKAAINGNSFVKYYRYLSHKTDIDQIAVILDCDEYDCVVTARKLLIEKIRADFGSILKPTSITLFKMEFETMFIYNCSELSNKIDYLNIPDNFDIERSAARRDAKGEISSLLTGTNYKETLHQAAFSSYFDPSTWAERYKDLTHFMACLAWHVSPQATVGAVK